MEQVRPDACRREDGRVERRVSIQKWKMKSNLACRLTRSHGNRITPTTRARPVAVGSDYAAPRGGRAAPGDGEGLKTALQYHITTPHAEYIK